MLFTGNDIVNHARDRVPRASGVQLDPFMVARQLNDVIRLLVRKVVAVDPERLAEEVVISNADTVASTTEIDLTASSTREWLWMGHFDWRDSAAAEYEGEVVLSTIEARHRAITEYGHLGEPIAYLFDRMRKLKKVSGWSGVYDLRAYGVVTPTEFDPQDVSDFARVLDYPEPLFRAAQTGFLYRVGPHLNPLQGQIQEWKSEFESAFADLEEDAQSHIGDGRIEDVPHLGFET